jgi:hypothetical protein
MKPYSHSSSFIVRLEQHESGTRFFVQDVKNGQRFVFTSWQDFKSHLDQSPKIKGLR